MTGGSMALVYSSDDIPLAAVIANGYYRAKAKAIDDMMTRGWQCSGSVSACGGPPMAA